MKTIQQLTDELTDATMAFYGDCLTTYPELLDNLKIQELEIAMRRPVPSDMEAEDNPAYLLLVFLSEYKDAVDLPSYESVYGAFDALVAACQAA